MANVGSDINKISKDGTFIIAGTRLPDYTSKTDDLYFFVLGQKPASEQFFNDTSPLYPIDNWPNYTANDTLQLVIIIAAIVGIIATVIFVKSRKKITR